MLMTDTRSQGSSRPQSVIVMNTKNQRCCDIKLSTDLLVPFAYTPALESREKDLGINQGAPRIAICDSIAGSLTWLYRAIGA